jgi:hypothetical protein
MGLRRELNDAKVKHTRIALLREHLAPRGSDFWNVERPISQLQVSRDSAARTVQSLRGGFFAGKFVVSLCRGQKKHTMRKPEA